MRDLFPRHVAKCIQTHIASFIFAPMNPQDPLGTGTCGAFESLAARWTWLVFGLNQIPRTLINMEDERSSRISILVDVYIDIYSCGAARPMGVKGVEDLRVRSPAPSGRANKLWAEGWAPSLLASR